MVARLPEAPSLAAQGMLGQTEARWALNHGHLRGRAGSPPRKEGVVTPQAPFSMHPSTPTKLPSSLLQFYFPPSNDHQ